MTKPIQNQLEKIPVVNVLVKLFKRIKLPGLEGLSLYNLLDLYFTGIIKGAITTRASAIAFSFFTALFPFLMFLLIIIPYIPIDDFKIEFLHFLESFLPPKTSEFFFENIFDNIDQTKQGGLLSSVFILSLLLMANGVSAIFSGFENSYHEHLSRSFIKQYLYALGVALILSIILLVTIVILGYFQIYVVQNLLDTLKKSGFKVGKGSLIWFDVAKYIFFVLMIYIATSILYFFGTKEGRYSHFFSIGAMFTTILIIIMSYLFGIYIEHFSQYNKLYGSIGALLILLFYLWLIANVLLLGYELNASLQKLKRKH